MSVQSNLSLTAVTFLVLACLVTFANSLNNSFHLDDYFRIVDNPGIQRFSPWWRHFVDVNTMSTLDRIRQFRPLLPLSFSIDYVLFGETPYYFLLTNLLLHILTTLVFFFFALELLTYWHKKDVIAWDRQKTSALCISLFFAVHPISGIPVNYISARDLIMMELFLLCSMLSYLRLRRLGDSTFRWLFCLVFFTLSLCSKTNGVVVPLIIVATEVTIARKQFFARETWLRALPFMVIIALFFAYTKWFLKFSDLNNISGIQTYSFLSYFLTQAKLHLFHYMRNYFWPFALHLHPLIPIEYGLNFHVFAGLSFICCSITAAWYYRHTFTLASYCALNYWILMSLESSFLPFKQLGVDYRAYAPSIFLYLLFFLFLGTIFHYRIALGISLILSFLLGLCSWYQNTIWKTEETLWQHSIMQGGDAIAHLNYAMSLTDRNDPRIRKHLEQALNIRPNYISAQINLGLLLISLGDTIRGLELCQGAVALDQKRADSHYWLSRAYARLHQFSEAAIESANSVSLDPNNLEYLYQAALDAQQIEQYQESLNYLNILLKTNPNYKLATFAKGFAQQQLGLNFEAVVTYRESLAKHPEHLQTHLNLGYALRSLGLTVEAEAQFEIGNKLRINQEAQSHEPNR